jgi:hypothetical protein
VTLRYSDVASVKGRNPVVKVLKTAGERAATVAILPFFIIAALLGFVPDC